MLYTLGMHVQLPDSLLDQIATGTKESRQEAPEPTGVPLDRVVLNRPGRKVKFYFRKNRYKRCYSDLTEEQMKTLFSALQKIGKVKRESLIFDNDVYLVSPATKRHIA